MIDYSHLDALNLRLSNERARYAKDNNPLRKVWIAQIEKEIDDELKFLGVESDKVEMSDDELLNELLG